MPVNLIDPSDVSRFLAAQAEGDTQIAGWLDLALAKSLRRRPESAVEARSLPLGAPAWLAAKWQDGGPFHDFRPDDVLLQKVRHIRDWLQAARAEAAPFLVRVNGRGEPLKLLNLDLDAAAHAADKYFERLNRAVHSAEETGKTSTVMGFDDGARIAQLLDVEALKAEGRRMGSCLGAQGPKLLGGEAVYYSLRDAQDEPQATIALRSDNTLLECKGRRNEPLPGKYLPPIVAFLKKRCVRLSRASRDLRALLQDDSGELHVLNDLPSPFAWRETLELTDNDMLTKLPGDLTVQGNLLLQGCRNLAEAGTFLTVTGNLEVRGCGALRNLARDTRVGGSLVLDDCALEKLLRGLTVRESILLNRCAALAEIDVPLQLSHSLVIRHCARFETLPEALNVGRDLEIKDCPRLRRLPESLRVGGRIVTDFGSFTNAAAARQAFAAKYAQGRPVR